MTHSSDEDIELCSVNGTEPNFLQKNTKISKKFVNFELIRADFQFKFIITS